MSSSPDRSLLTLPFQVLLLSSPLPPLLILLLLLAAYSSAAWRYLLLAVGARYDRRSTPAREKEEEGVRVEWVLPSTPSLLADVDLANVGGVSLGGFKILDTVSALSPFPPLPPWGGVLSSPSLSSSSSSLSTVSPGGNSGSSRMLSDTLLSGESVLPLLPPPPSSSSELEMVELQSEPVTEKEEEGKKV